MCSAQSVNVARQKILLRLIILGNHPVGFSKTFFAFAPRSNTSPHRRHVAESLLHANEELSAKYGSRVVRGASRGWMGRNAGSTLIVALLSLPRPLEPIGISSTNFRLRRHFRRPGTSESSCPESSIPSLFKPFRPRRGAIFVSTHNDRKRARFKLVNT